MYSVVEHLPQTHLKEEKMSWLHIRVPDSRWITGIFLSFFCLSLFLPVSLSFYLFI